MILLIDAGNTRIKWALAGGMTRYAHASALAGKAAKPDGEDWICRSDLPTSQVDRLPDDIEEQLAGLNPGATMHDIRRIWVSNVAGEAVAQHILRIAAGSSAQPHFAVASAAQCGVRNGYTSPAQLGSDRWAALIAAWHRLKGPCLVVNSGTATTIDALSGQGKFAGGLILPGLALMQRSLVGATDRLDSAQGIYAAFPLNSADAIYSGAIQASCGAIERQYALLDDDSASLVLSGGAAKILQPYLDRNFIKSQPRVVDNLVLRGLQVMAQEAN